MAFGQKTQGPRNSNSRISVTKLKDFFCENSKNRQVSKTEVAVLNRFYHTNVATEEAACESETLMNKYVSYHFLDDTGGTVVAGEANCQLNSNDSVKQMDETENNARKSDKVVKVHSKKLDQMVIHASYAFSGLHGKITLRII